MKYEWLKKTPILDFFGNVSSIELRLKCEDENKESIIGSCTVFSDLDIKSKSEWTQDKIDQFAEDMRAQSKWDELLINNLS
tara:strand:+ start:407 stop:649 length:243 start_codon:yes stop_codon:yes gene_type:complete